MNRDNIELVIDILEKADKDSTKFDMNVWLTGPVLDEAKHIEKRSDYVVESIWIGAVRPRNDCGTAACAIGLVMLDERARERGLVAAARTNTRPFTSFVPAFSKDDFYATGMSAVDEFLEFDNVATTPTLFDSETYVDREVKFANEVEPHHVVARLRNLLRLGEHAFLLAYQ